MSNVPEFLKINDSESELDYFLRIYNTPIKERYNRSVFNLDSADGISDDPVIRPEKDEADIEENESEETSKPKPKIPRGADLTDMEFGKLKVRCLDEERSGKYKYYICDCECGGSKSIRSDALLSGKTTSCGCVQRESSRAPRPSMMKDLSGQRFGKLKAIKPDDSITDRSQGIYWICECECGNIKSIRSSDLVNQKTKSCGHCHDRNRYDLSGEYGIGYTANGTRFLFDKEDYYKIAPYTWGTDAYGYIVAHYRDSNGERKSIKMHRLVMDVTDPKIFIDHIHHNLADNRKEELRIVTHSENLQNTKLSIVNTSGHTGVYYNSINHNWRALIGLNNKIIDLGSYPTKEEAIRVREEAEIKYFGEHRYQGTIATDQILQRTASNPEPTRVTRSNPFENVPKNPTSSIQNLNSANTSGYNGVYFDKLNNNWRARIRVNGKLISLGSYPTAEEAYRARLEADKKYLGR